MSPRIPQVAAYVLRHIAADRRLAAEVLASRGVTHEEAMTWNWYRKMMADCEFRELVVQDGLRRRDLSLCEGLARLWCDSPATSVARSRAS